MKKSKSTPFAKGRKLGQGNFGTLYRGKDEGTVIKVSKPYRDRYHLEKEKTKAKEEQKIFQLLYPSTPLEMRTTQKNNLGGGVLEYTLSFVPGSEAVWLYQDPTALENMNRIPFSHRVYALQTMMTQLETLHQNRIIHSDIKADNALLSKIKSPPGVQYNVPALSLIDTGLSFKNHGESEFDCVNGPKQGTVSTMAPEVFTDHHNYYTSDIYSASAMMAKIAGAQIVSEYNDYHYKRKNIKTLKKVKKSLTDLNKRLIKNKITQEQFNKQLNTLENKHPTAFAILYRHVSFDVLELKFKKARSKYEKAKLARQRNRSFFNNPTVNDDTDTLLRKLQQQAQTELTYKNNNETFESAKMEFDQIKIELKNYYENQKVNFSGLAQEVQKHLPRPSEYKDNRIDTNKETSGRDIQLLFSQMTKMNPHDRPTASELTSVFTMLYNLINAQEMIQRYEIEFNKSGNEDLAIAKSSLKDYRSIEKMLKTMPVNRRRQLFSYKYFERKVTTRRKYAKKMQKKFLKAVKDKIDNDPNRPLDNSTVQYGKAHLDSLKQQAGYYSSLLKECINDLKKGQHRNGVAAVRFCFDIKHNHEDKDAMQLLKRGNRRKKIDTQPQSSEEKKGINQEITLNTLINSPSFNQTQLQQLNTHRKTLNLPHIQYNKDKGFYIEGMPNRHCVKLMRYFQQKMSSWLNPSTMKIKNNAPIHIKIVYNMLNKFNNTKNGNMAEDKGEYSETKRPMRTHSRHRLLGSLNSRRHNTTQDEGPHNPHKIEQPPQKKISQNYNLFFKRALPGNPSPQDTLKRQFEVIKSQTSNGENLNSDDARKLYQYLKLRLDGEGTGEIKLGAAEEKMQELLQLLSYNSPKNN